MSIRLLWERRPIEFIWKIFLCSFEMGELGLNEHHQDQLIQFLRFCRYQRAQRVRSVDGCFDEIENSRLSDSTFTKDEVLDVLRSLKEVLRAELESELLNSSHTSLLLLRQLCGQAEKWHLKLLVNLSELENRELLDAVQQFEEQQFNISASKRPTINVLKRLEPLEGSGVAPLLQTEIDRLRDENLKLRDRMQKIQGTAIDAVESQKGINTQLQQAKLALEKAQQETSGPSEQDISMLEQQLSALKGQLNHNLEASQGNREKLEGELTQAHRRLLEVKEQLEMTEQELEKKFSQTAVYKNLKGILLKKNQQIKQLRSSLNKYEPDGGNFDED